LLRRVYSTK